MDDLLLTLPIIQPEAAAPAKPRKPDWLRVKLPVGPAYANVRRLVDEHKLHTICESGNCPNMGECWGAGTATFMILGNVCTRSCSFCAVATGRPTEYDLDEPRRVAEAIQLMGVKHAVLTSRKPRRAQGPRAPACGTKPWCKPSSSAPAPPSKP